MRVNFIIEGTGLLKYIGCSTAARQMIDIFKKNGIEVEINSKETNFDIVHAHTFGPFAIHQSLKSKNSVTIISAHSTPSVNRNNVITGNWKIWNFIYSTIYNKFDYIIAVSDYIIDELKQIGIKKKIFVIENGIDNEKFRFNKEKGIEFRKEYGFDKKDFIVSNIAQITPRKGVYDFIEVAKKLPDIQFVWIGGFPYKFVNSDYFKLKKIINKNADLDNLKFIGFVPDIIGAYSGSDVFLNPTFAETFGLTIIESAACNLPVIARKLDIFTELFNDSINYGNNVNELISEINNIKDEKPNQSQINKLKLLSKKYDINLITKKLINLYSELLQEKKN